MKWIHNITAEMIIYRGVEIAAGAFYLIPKEHELNFTSDDDLVHDLSEGIVKMSSDGTSDLLVGFAGHVKFLLNNTVVIEEAPQSYPFNNKYLPDGKKLYRRKHGIVKDVAAGETVDIDMVIPYAHCKIDEVEIVNCNAGDTVDFIVLDSEAGSYSGTPYMMLNQFGFDVNLSEGYYSDSSNYEADLYFGMIMRVKFKNTSNETVKAGVNFVLHEVK